MTLKEDYPDEADPEARLYKDYKAWKKLDELEAMRPAKLDDRQQSLLQLFYKCRQYAKDIERIPYEISEKFCANSIFELDIALFTVQELDSEYLQICFDKQKRDLENIKKNGAKK